MDDSMVDLETIRARVHQIKSSWSQSEKKRRAREGRQRRAQLEEMLLGERSPLLSVFRPAVEAGDRSAACV